MTDEPTPQEPETPPQEIIATPRRNTGSSVIGDSLDSQKGAGMTTPERSAVFNDITDIVAAERAAFGGHPMDPLLPLAQKLVADVEVAIAAESHPTPAPPVPPTPIPPSPSPPPTPPPGPAPGPTPQPPPASTGHRPVLAFTNSAKPTDPVAGNLIYQFTWADVNPSQHTLPDFTKVEAAMLPWVQADKLVPVRAFQFVLGDGTQGTPQWVLDIVGVVDAALHVPNYFHPQWDSLRRQFIAQVANWLNGYAFKHLVPWVEIPFGIFGETKVDSQQGHTIDLAAWKAAGYTDAAWHDTLVAEAAFAYSAFGGHFNLVANMDKSFIGGDPNYTAEKLGADLRAQGFWLGDHGYRQGQTPSPMYLAGPSIYEQYLSSGSTGNNADTEVREMVGYADAHGGYSLVYSSDIPKATAALHWANG